MLFSLFLIITTENLLNYQRRILIFIALPVAIISPLVSDSLKNR